MKPCYNTFVKELASRISNRRQLTHSGGILQLFPLRSNEYCISQGCYCARRSRKIIYRSVKKVIIVGIKFKSAHCKSGKSCAKNDRHVYVYVCSMKM